MKRISCGHGEDFLKKKRRVTDEVAKNEICLKCETTGCYPCEYEISCRKIELYAADLLDARALLKEAEDTLKWYAMQENISIDAGVKAVISFPDKARAFIAKLKEYAE